MLPGQKFTFADLLRILKRRSWIVVIPFAIGLAVSPVISNHVPKLYRSEALIRVVPQRVPDTLVKSMLMKEKMEERLPAISSVILSRSRLERIVRDFNLYGVSDGPSSMEALVERLRRDIEVKPDGPESFRVYYVSTKVKLAQLVTARLASLYLEENLRDRANLADQTNAFLESQLGDAKRRLIEHEKQLEEYRRKYSGELPSQLDSNLQTILNAQIQLQTLSESVNRVRERRLLVERQIADLQSLPTELTATIDGVDRSQPAPLTTAQQLEAAKGQLDANKLKYKPEHPDVRAAARAVHDLEGRLEAETTNPRPAAERALTPAQFVRQKRLNDLRAELDVIDHQISANQGEETRLKQLMASYQVRVDAVPTRESELVELTRDYSTIQTEYQSLLAKREDSKIAADLERGAIGEQFKILDPASLPEMPYNRVQRLGIVASGAIAGFLFGLLYVGLTEYRDASFKDQEDVARTLALPVLAVVPLMISDRRRRSQVLTAIAVNVAAVVALATSVAVVVSWRLHR